MEVKVHYTLLQHFQHLFTNLFFSGEPQDELVHYLCPGPGHGVLGDALPGQELSQNPHLQAGNQDQAQELHGAARHSKGLHSYYCRYTKMVKKDYFNGFCIIFSVVLVLGLAGFSCIALTVFRLYR